MMVLLGLKLQVESRLQMVKYCSGLAWAADPTIKLYLYWEMGWRISKRVHGSLVKEICSF